MKFFVVSFDVELPIPYNIAPRIPNKTTARLSDSPTLSLRGKNESTHPIKAKKAISPAQNKIGGRQPDSVRFSFGGCPFGISVIGA